MSLRCFCVCMYYAINRRINKVATQMIQKDTSERAEHLIYRLSWRKNFRGRIFFWFCLKPFQPNVPFLYLLKTLETKGFLTFSWVEKKTDFYVNSSFPLLARLWNSLPIECFPLTYDLNGFESRISRHLLTVGSL